LKGIFSYDLLQQMNQRMLILFGQVCKWTQKWKKLLDYLYFHWAWDG